jgi:GNAT superfamily N-acetyltransferase
MRFKLRRARREDADTVIDLISELAHFEKLDPPAPDARERLLRDGWGRTPRFETWLAESEGRAVGYAIVLETYSTFLARPTLYIEDVYVTPEFRGRGAGYALFRLAADLAVKRGCGRIEWLCLDWNTGAQAFYEKLGARRLNDWLPYRLMPDQVADLPPLSLDFDIDAG